MNYELKRKGGYVKVKVLVRVVLIILEYIAQQTETTLDDYVVQKIKDIIEPS